jgi:rSAM/selenodomain-associated transferase 2
MKSEPPPEQSLLSIIIPTLNEGRSIGATLEAITRVGARVEVIVADGGSEDETVEIARRFGARVITCKRGRGLQMHSGASAARGEAFWFLHADTIIPPDGASRIIEALIRDSEIVAGNFTIRFDGERRAARFLTWLYPQLRKLGLCYGDSAIFVRASVYREVGGFKPFPLFEDLDLVQRLKTRGRLVHLPLAVITSSRRFEGRSFALTFARWAVLQVLYWAGVNPHTLNRLYAPIRRASD